MAKTTIQVSTGLKERLERLKEHPRQPYEEVIQEALDWIEEGDADLSADTKKAITASRREIEKGRFVTLEDMKAELGL